MANNYTTSNNFTNQNDALSSAPIWTVPEESTSTSDKRMLLSNDNINPPVYNTFSATSARAIDDQPPNYFDISIVPNSAILHNNEVTPYTEASKAKIERNMKGVLSSDSLIDKNPDQLWLYFMTYLNEKPRLKVEICGYYTEVKLSTSNRKFDIFSIDFIYRLTQELKVILMLMVIIKVVMCKKLVL
jgi:hypothetical protein